MSRLLEYYEEELNYLLEAGREFARVHPERAQFLAPDNPRGRDPHVERLMESFAFLAGRIRMRLEDDFPQLTHSLLQLVWPHYLKPIPAMATLEFQPKEGMVKEVVRVPRGSLIDSDPVRGTRACRFQTRYDVDLLPLALESARLESGTTGDGVIRLEFRFHSGADPSALGPAVARIHLVGEPAVTYELYRLLTASVRRADIVYQTEAGETRRRTFGDGVPAPAGLAESESVLTSSERSFPGFRLLQEYFLFPEKFLYLDFPVGEALKGSGATGNFSVEVALTEAPPKGLRVSEQNFRLNCTPILNLFERDAEPIRLDRKAFEYRVMADFSRLDEFEVYEVRSVESVGRTSRKRIDYRPYFAFHHLATGADRQAAPFYHTITRLSQTRAGWETYLSFPESGNRKQPEAETISCHLTCTNGALTDQLRIGQICHPGEGVPEYVRCRNITQATKAVWPPIEGGAEWRFIAHLAFNLISLSDLDTFRGVLSLYGELGDRSTVEANRRKIEGVQSITLGPAQTLYRGAVIRGTEVAVELLDDHFADRGDIRLFAAALSEFLALYASINSFVRLVVVATPSGMRLTCPPRFSVRKSL